MDTRQRRGNAKWVPLLAIAFVLAFIAEPVYAQVFRINVRMNGDNQIPPVTTAATGIGRLTVDTTTGTISGTVTFSSLSTATTAGHIHMGGVRRNGSPIIFLTGGLGVTDGRMRLPPTVLTAAQMSALMANRLYLNVHTVSNPSGEIRGQIRFNLARPVP